MKKPQKTRDNAAANLAAALSRILYGRATARGIVAGLLESALKRSF
jgi:hypothetical protein